jgi:hypothetical protein
MQLTLDTSALTEIDRKIIALLHGGEAPASNGNGHAPKAEKAAPAPKAEPKAKPAEKTEEPAEAPAAEEGGATMEQAVEAATKLVSTGNAAKVKAALAEVGAKRVSELAEGDIPAFLAALDA